MFWKKKKKQGQLSFRNLFKQQVFPLFLLAAVLKHKLNFDWANLIFAALSLTLLKVIHALFPVVYAAVDVSDSQKGDNFLSNGSCFDWSFWDYRRQSIFVGVGGRKCQNNALVTGAIFFLCPGSRASRKMPRSPRLTHNTPVMQATYTWASLYYAYVRILCVRDVWVPQCCYR